MNVNKKLKEYIDKHGVKQTYLAECTGIPAPALSMMLNGNRKLTAEELGKIAKALQVSADIFLD